MKESRAGINLTSSPGMTFTQSHKIWFRKVGGHVLGSLVGPILPITRGELNYSHWEGLGGMTFTLTHWSGPPLFLLWSSEELLSELIKELIPMSFQRAWDHLAVPSSQIGRMLKQEFESKFMRLQAGRSVTGVIPQWPSLRAMLMSNCYVYLAYCKTELMGILLNRSNLWETIQ